MKLTGDIICFDIDEVFYPWREAIVSSLKERFGWELTLDTHDVYAASIWLRRDYPELYPIFMNNGADKEHLIYMGNNGWLLKVKPYSEVASTLDKIKTLGKKIALVTTRGLEEQPDIYYPNGVEHTKQWLANEGIYYDYLIFTKRKDTALKELETKTGLKVMAHVDDLPRHVIELHNAGYSVIIRDQPHNQPTLNPELGYDIVTGKTICPDPKTWSNVLSSPNVQRIYSLNEVLSLIEP